MNDSLQPRNVFVALVRVLLAGLFMGGLVAAAEPAVERSIPDKAVPEAAVFLEGQNVTVRIPGEPSANRWQVLDDGGEQVVAGTLEPATEHIDAGKLCVGWYRVEFLDPNGACIAWTTAAVLSPLSAPTPQDSPICADAAIAWFARGDAGTQERFAHLAALAGLNWTRDRMRWQDIQPQGDRFEPATTYDSAAQIQARYGLKVLQVFHDTPSWAVSQGRSRGQFVADLRILYRFGEAMGRRFKGQVLAWEPWNEANIPEFGGHTTDEMCSYQKAAWLGFKAGDPNCIVCWNVSTAAPTPLQTQTVLENEAWPYFDTYNIHTYDWPDSYARLWRPIYAAASGRPIWVTESDRGMKYEGPAPSCELPRKGELQKAEFMAQSYASSLGAGVARHFHFILGNYHETSNGVQFGLLRMDQTPRPAYVALAAIGRLLAGARCLGKWPIADRPDAHVYAFSALPDGHRRDVLVAWAEAPGDWDTRGKTTVDWQLPADIPVHGVYDYLGRSMGPAVPAQLRSAPVFVLVESGSASKLPLTPPPESEPRPGKPGPAVLQLVMPPTAAVKIQQIPWSCEYEHRVQAGERTELPLWLYNFSKGPLRGTVTAEHLPEGWTFTPASWTVTVGPMARAGLTAAVVIPRQQPTEPADCWIKLRGDFGPDYRPVLAFRLITEPGQGYPRETD